MTHETNAKIKGVDVYILASLPVNFPNQSEIFSLDKVTSRGQNVNDPRCQKVLDVGLLCLQFKVTKTDLKNNKINEEIGSLLTQISNHYEWVNCVKRCDF